jgi:hypothetical protein
MDDVQRGISSIGQSSTTTVDTNGNTADKVAHADCDTRPEEGISGVVGVGGVELGARDILDLLREDDGHDDAVDGDDLTEDDGDQVLGSDAGGLNTTTENRRAGNEDAPVCNALESRCTKMYEVVRTMQHQQQRDRYKARYPE